MNMCIIVTKMAGRRIGDRGLQPRLYIPGDGDGEKSKNALGKGQETLLLSHLLERTVFISSTHFCITWYAPQTFKGPTFNDVMKMKLFNMGPKVLRMNTTFVNQRLERLLPYAPGSLKKIMDLLLSFFLLFLSPCFSKVLVLMIGYLKTSIATRINHNDDEF